MIELLELLLIFYSLGVTFFFVICGFNFLTTFYVVYIFFRICTIFFIFFPTRIAKLGKFETKKNMLVVRGGW